MSEKKLINTPEDLIATKNNIALDDEGMMTYLHKRFILTPQDTFSDMMKAAADLGGINLAKVFMRRAGYEAAYKVAQAMIDNLNITGEDLVRHYTRTGGKRGWAFDEVEIIDGNKGIFLCKAYYSPFVIRFSGKSHVCVCDFLAGAFEAMCHAGGFKNMRIIETKCMARGDEICVFENMKV